MMGGELEDADSGEPVTVADVLAAQADLEPVLELQADIQDGLIVLSKKDIEMMPAIALMALRLVRSEIDAYQKRKKQSAGAQIHAG